MLFGNVFSSERWVFRSGAITIYILAIVQHVRFIHDLPFEPISEHGKGSARKRRVTVDMTLPTYLGTVTVGVTVS